MEKQQEQQQITSNAEKEEEKEKNLKDKSVQNRSCVRVEVDVLGCPS